MNRLTLTAAVILLGSAVGSVAADTDFYANPSEPHARLITNFERPADNLFAVRVTEINGTLVGPTRDKTIWMKPDRYSIEARKSVVRRDYTSSVGRHSRSPDAANSTLDLDLEAGKSYYLGLDTSAKMASEWKVVVWKVEQHH